MATIAMRSVKVVKVSKPRTPFMVAVPANVTGSKRVRRYFKDRETALAYVISVKQQGFLGAEGQGVRLPEAKSRSVNAPRCGSPAMSRLA